jgi:hypothetical protein
MVSHRRERETGDPLLLPGNTIVDHPPECSMKFQRQLMATARSSGMSGHEAQTNLLEVGLVETRRDDSAGGKKECYVCVRDFDPFE